MWTDLHGEVVDAFSMLVGCIDVHSDHREGFGIWNPEARAKLEAERREYKTAKQRIYDAKTASVQTCACGAPVNRKGKSCPTCATTRARERKRIHAAKRRMQA